MKKILAIVAAVAIIASAVFIGYRAGVDHVIYNQELWIMDFEAPDSEHDLTFYSFIDGECHEYYGYIGCVGITTVNGSDGTRIFPLC